MPTKSRSNRCLCHQRFKDQPGITTLHLLEKLCEVADEDIQEQYAKVFTGLDNFGNEYIKLKGNATPFALHAPRNIPIPLRDKVQEELRKMETMGIIR